MLYQICNLNIYLSGLVTTMMICTSDHAKGWEYTNSWRGRRRWGDELNTIFINTLIVVVVDRGGGYLLAFRHSTTSAPRIYDTAMPLTLRGERWEESIVCGGS